MTATEDRQADSPTGTPATVARAGRAARSPAYRAEQERLAEYGEIACQVILHRTRKGLTQADLAKLVGTSRTAISRIENGQHPTTEVTLRRLDAALGLRLVIRFEDATASCHMSEGGRAVTIA